MAIDATPSQVATSALQAIPFGSMIGGPLNACIEAQAMAAQTSWQFIQEVGLNTNPETGQEEAVNVSFQFVQNGRVVQLNVPLLTIVPIPYIAIQDIDISFKANISASSSNVSEQSTSSSTDAALEASGGLRFGPFHMSAKMNASYSSKKDSRATQESKYSVEYTMDVNVKAGQDDMPAGMAKVLEMLNSSIDSIDTKGELHVSDQVVSLAGGGSTYISYKNNEGYYAPNDIKLYEYKDNHAGTIVSNDDCQKASDDSGVLCVFKKEGFYCVKAGEKMLVINVTK